jgi:hypothetical protein
LAKILYATLKVKLSSLYKPNSMKTLKFWFFIIIIISISCEKEANNKFSAEMPGRVITDMELDNNNVLYYVTWTEDSTIVSPEPGLLQIRHYLSRRRSESDNFEILDKNYPSVDEIVLDRNNNVWGRSGKEIYFWDGHVNKKIIGLSDNDGLFKSIAVDKENNIWTGGSNTGLYKIDNHLNITKYDTIIFQTPDNDISDIHVDKNNVKWISLGFYQRVLKITNEKWEVLFSDVADLSTPFWCLVTDKNSDLWIGTGHFSTTNSLIKFDGHTWEIIEPRNEKNEPVNGTVYRMFADSTKIYVIVEKVVNAMFSSNDLLTYDGSNWDKIYDIPDDAAIYDMKFDYYRHILWVRTSQGFFKLAI